MEVQRESAPSSLVSGHPEGGPLLPAGDPEMRSGDEGRSASPSLEGRKGWEEEGVGVGAELVAERDGHGLLLEMQPAVIVQERSTQSNNDPVVSVKLFKVRIWRSFFAV